MTLQAKLLARLLALAILFLLYSKGTTQTFTIDYQRDCYAKDGECYRYIAGEMHYFRIPPHYWEDRLLKLRAAGFTTVQTYIPWNVHVPAEDTYSFEGIANVYSYLETAWSLGLTVIVRPGPFLATEWDYGGFPAWLLKDRPTLDVRRNETVFMTEVKKWYSKLLPTLKPYLYSSGGPIIAVQVENEYGSNKPCDAGHFDYMTQLRDIYREHLGEEIVLLTVDGDSYKLAQCGNIEGLYSTLNFGSGGNITNKFLVQRKQEPRGPFVCSAFFSGWLDHWGHKFAKTGAEHLAQGLQNLLEFNGKTASVSMYMFHGGTNFAYMQGGRGDWNNATTTDYPRLWGKMTSYDYDAPLSEAGDTTWKYQLLRQVIGNYSKTGLIPDNTTKEHVGPVQLEEFINIFDMVRLLQHDPNCVVQSQFPLPMEQMGQNHGVVVYQTMIPEEIPLPAVIDIDLYGDRVYVMTQDGEVQISSRNRPYKSFSVSHRKLFILVEDNGHSNTGHVRYSYKYYQKGIIGNVTANGQVLSGWNAYLISNFLPRGPYENTPEEASKCSWRALVATHGKKHDVTVNLTRSKGFIPTFYRSTSPLLLERDTYVDTQGWGKGILMVLYNKATHIDDINLGRYWPLAGPQKRHYCPSPGPTREDMKSTFLLFELERAPTNLTIVLTDTPLVDGSYDSSQQ